MNRIYWDMKIGPERDMNIIKWILPMHFINLSLSRPLVLVEFLRSESVGGASPEAGKLSDASGMLATIIVRGSSPG